MRASRTAQAVGVIVIAAVVGLLFWWYQLQDDARVNLSRQAPNETATVDATEPLNTPSDEAGLIVRVTGAHSDEVTTVLAQQANTRIFGERRTNGEFVFANDLAGGARLVAWTVGSSTDQVTAVSDLVRFDGASSQIHLHLGRVWPLEVELRRQGGSPDDDADVGLRFPTVDLATTWAQKVQVITTKPVAWFLKTRAQDGCFSLPLIPAATTIRASGPWGRFAGESSDFELSGPERIVLGLSALPASRLIRVRDGTGVPVEVKLAVDVGSKPDTQGETTWRMVRDGTGDDGLLEVPTEAADRLVVRIVDERWVPERYKYSLDAGADMLDIQVRPATSLRLRVQYDDAQPYLGMVRVEPEYPERDPTVSEYLQWSGRLVDAEPTPTSDDPFEVDRYGPQTQFYRVIVFDRIPSELPLTVSTEGGKRIGYPSYETTVFALDVPREILVVIPSVLTDRSPSRIRILGDIPEAAGCTVSIYRVSEFGTAPVGSFSLADSRESELIRHPGRYRVRLTGASAWQSEEFELTAGVVHDVSPKPAPAVTVKARILDETGLPVEGGTLDIDSRGAPIFPAKPIADTVGVSNTDGYVTLGGQPHGKSIFRLEAFECQPILVEASLGKDREVFLGEFRLEPAKGEVHIRMPKADDSKLSVLVNVASPFSLYRRDYHPEAEELIVLKGLAVGRTYSISVHIRGAEHVAKGFNGVAPTIEQPIIELDATDIDVAK